LPRSSTDAWLQFFVRDVDVTQSRFFLRCLPWAACHTRFDYEGTEAKESQSTPEIRDTLGCKLTGYVDEEIATRTESPEVGTPDLPRRPEVLADHMTLAPFAESPSRRPILSRICAPLPVHMPKRKSWRSFSLRAWRKLPVPIACRRFHAFSQSSPRFRINSRGLNREPGNKTKAAGIASFVLQPCFLPPEWRARFRHKSKSIAWPRVCAFERYGDIAARRPNGSGQWGYVLT